MSLVVASQLEGNLTVVKYMKECLHSLLSPLGVGEHLTFHIHITMRSGDTPRSNCLGDVQNHRTITWTHTEKEEGYCKVRIENRINAGHM